MGEAPCATIPAAPRRATSAAHFFRLQRHGRRKLHVVRLGSSGNRGVKVVRGRGLRLRRWLSSAVWRLAELCVAALSTNGGAAAAPRCGPASPPTWAGIEPCFAAPFVPVVAMGKTKRAGAQDY